MKITAIIDSNVVSGTILLDDLSPLTLKLIHRYVDSGVNKYLTINTVNCQPQKQVFDFAFLNPYYVENLFVDVNGTLQEVMAPGEEQLDSTPNPLNDHIYTTSQIPVIAEVETLVADPIIRESLQEFSLLSHSPAPSLVSMEDYSASVHFLYDERGIRFTANGQVIISSDVFELNHYSELTIAIKGHAPSRARLILINQAGQERIVEMNNSYELYGRTCFSTSIISSTLEARIELDYESDEAGNFLIKDIYVGKTAQYFETDNMNIREVQVAEINTHPITAYVFNFDRLPEFGLRTLLDFTGSNGIKIQFSNSRIRVCKKVNDTIVQTIMSPVVSNISQLGVVIDDVSLKMYSNGEVVKNVQFQSPTEPGDYEVEVGATTSDPDYDSNTLLNVTVVNKNPFED